MTAQPAHHAPTSVDGAQRGLVDRLLPGVRNLAADRDALREQLAVIRAESLPRPPARVPIAGHGPQSIRPVVVRWLA